MLFFKLGVKFNSNVYTDAMLHAIQTVYGRRNLDATITSANDSTHGPHSYHMQDRALDVRFWNVPEVDRVFVKQQLQSALPGFYDVVQESDHFHIEADAVKEKAGQ